MRTEVCSLRRESSICSFLFFPLILWKQVIGTLLDSFPRLTGSCSLEGRVSVNIQDAFSYFSISPCSSGGKVKADPLPCRKRLEHLLLPIFFKHMGVGILVPLSLVPSVWSEGKWILECRVGFVYLFGLWGERWEEKVCILSVSFLQVCLRLAVTWPPRTSLMVVSFPECSPLGFQWPLSPHPSA